MNKVVFVGRLTRDPEVTTTASGITLARFSLAINRNYISASGEKETDFINIVVWRTLAENCGKYLKKGNLVAVEGSMQSRTYEDSSGNKRYTVEALAEHVEFLVSPQVTDGQAEPIGETNKREGLNNVNMREIKDSDLPF